MWALTGFICVLAKPGGTSFQDFKSRTSFDFRHMDTISKQWFEFCLEIQFPCPFLTSIKPTLYINFLVLNLVFASFFTSFYDYRLTLNIASASSGNSNHGLETTVYRPLEPDTIFYCESRSLGVALRSVLKGLSDCRHREREAFEFIIA